MNKKEFNVYYRKRYSTKDEVFETTILAATKTEAWLNFDYNDNVGKSWRVIDITEV